jgi:hypothetical protein
MFVIDDEFHAELQDGEFHSLDEAVVELRRRATLPWDQPPNLAPCTNWRTCGRKYVIIEYDTSTTPWQELERTEYLEIDANGVRWLHV